MPTADEAIVLVASDPAPEEWQLRRIVGLLSRSGTVVDLPQLLSVAAKPWARGELVALARRATYVAFLWERSSERSALLNYLVGLADALEKPTIVLIGHDFAGVLPAQLQQSEIIERTSGDESRSPNEGKERPHLAASLFDQPAEFIASASLPAKSAGPSPAGASHPYPSQPSSSEVINASLRAMLDQFDVAMLLVEKLGRVVFANRAAATQLAEGSQLRVVDGHLSTASSADMAKLRGSLEFAQRGRDHMMIFGGQGDLTFMSVVPLAGGIALIILKKRQAQTANAVKSYAQRYSLTESETRVLEALCAGTSPSVVAQQYGMAVAAVRTQILAIRNKTGSASIRELLVSVALWRPSIGESKHEISMAKWLPRLRIVAAPIEPDPRGQH